MKAQTIALMAATGMFAMGQSALADTIFDNGVTPNTGLSSQLDAGYPFDSQVADDFMFAAGGPDYTVTDVHWTGLYFNQPPAGPNPVDFNIYIYADAGGVPTGGPTDPSGTALYAYNLPAVLGTVIGDPLDETYAYAVDLPTSFVATAGTTYWIAIQAVHLFPPQWGWRGDNANGGNAASGFPLLGTDYWTTVTPGTEMDFQLTGAAVPAPGALALIGLAGLAARRRRRA